jgi:hypothetical protein
MKTSNLKDESELTNLVIEGADSGESLSDSDKKYIEKFTNLEIFAFNETGLKCARNLPKLQKLLRIELCYNKIETGLESLAQYPLLRIIKLRYNNIKTFKAVEPLKGCKQLH